MSKFVKENLLAHVLCGVDDARACDPLASIRCNDLGKCKIEEKMEDQLDYILSPHTQCTYLQACAGSGKTEVLGLKAAYEICKWDKKRSGIAVLTFTNEAANTIVERIKLFYLNSIPTNHYIGTFDSFVHGYIAQNFGYSVCNVDSSKQDTSFHIIEKSTQPYNNNWLNNYKLNFPNPLRRANIYSNQIFYRLSDGKWCFSLGKDSTVTVDEYYNSSEIQKLITSIRQRKRNSHLFKQSFLIKMVIQAKEELWENGYATFEDMNIIALRCLKKDDIAKHIAKKFPLIMVDECQDLSATDIEVLKLLKHAGSTVHYIGDLNQAIYSFKDAHPHILEQHIADEAFGTMHLRDNFRSCQKIVDFACDLKDISSDITGHASEKCSENSAIYFEYKNVNDALTTFENILQHYGIPKDKSIVLTRASSLKAKLSLGSSTDYKKHKIINAVQLWGIYSPDARKEALSLLGLQIQQWLGSTGRRDNYYCPKEYDNIHRWRLTLRNILNELMSFKTINSFNRTYGEWYNAVRHDVLTIVNNQIKLSFPSQAFDFTSISYRTPNGTKSTAIELLSVTNDTGLHVDTIHSVKGCSYDATLLVSSPNKSGKTGYWEQWIDSKDEATRFAYVASTRPKYLLAWAVSQLTEERRRKIESIGLVKWDFKT